MEIPLYRNLVAAALFLAVSTAAAPQALTRMPGNMIPAQPPVPTTWHAPQLAAHDVVSLGPLQVAKAAPASPRDPIQIGTDRALAQGVPVAQWTRIPGGYVAKVRVASQGALGIRLRLDLGTVPGPFDVRVQGTDSQVIERMTIDPALGNTHWTPWTEGPAQVLELFSPVKPSASAVSITTVAHFTENPLTAKAGADSCTISTQCSTGDPAIDAAMAERKKSVVKLVFAHDTGGQFLCTGTLINTPLFPAPFILTANHCIGTATAASTLTTWWFYEAPGCNLLGTAPGLVQIAGGAQLTFTNYMVDSTLVRLNNPAPAGASFSSWTAAKAPIGQPIVSISNPHGDTTHVALGSIAQMIRAGDWPYDMYGITFSLGIPEPGSSGSGLFVMNAGGTLDLTGIFTGVTTDHSADGLSCTDLNEFGLYDRFEVFEPEIDQYIRGASIVDDEPNRVQDYANIAVDPAGNDKPLDQRTSDLVYANRRIDYAGDVDVYRFSIATNGTTVHIYTQGSLDTVGALLDSTGTEIAANDDENASSNNMGMTQTLDAGTYYVSVGHWDPQGTGAYSLVLSVDNAAAPPNYTDLWWNSPANSESGWGINLNHQGDIIFGTLFTYDASGKPLWLVLSRGEKQADGSYSGAIYTTTGPAFNASPWLTANVVATQVGTMTLRFSSLNTGTLSYTYNGIAVTKQITREVFGAASANCTFTTGDRNGATNYQDLWWLGPAESGWGVNVTQQGDVVVATLFDYDANGHATWYILAHGGKTGPGTYTGDLYTVTGPAFNASPWTAITATQVGTMTFAFSSGSTGTLTYTVNGVQVVKSIQRELFSSPMTQCQ